MSFILCTIMYVLYYNGVKSFSKEAVLFSFSPDIGETLPTVWAVLGSAKTALKFKYEI